jgi:antitoxin MazE
MKTKIKKWGNSLALRIPKALAEDSHLYIGSTVDVSVQNNLLVVKSINEKYTLANLVSKISSDNVHHDVNTFKSTGKEVW